MVVEGDHAGPRAMSSGHGTELGEQVVVPAMEPIKRPDDEEERSQIAAMIVAKLAAARLIAAGGAAARLAAGATGRGRS